MIRINKKLIILICCLLGSSQTLAAKRSKKSNRYKQKRKRACNLLTEKFIAPYAELKKYVDPKLTLPENNYADIIASQNKESCDDELLVKSTVKRIVKALKIKNNKIGVILPRTGPYADISRTISEGIRLALIEKNLDYGKLIIEKDGRSDANHTKKAIAELMYFNQVTMIIGGLDINISSTLAQWADKIAIPTLILSGRDILPIKSKFAFTIFPTQNNLANALSDVAKTRGYRRIAILRPMNGSADVIIELLKQRLTDRKIVITKEIPYQKGVFGSMETAAKTLFQTNATTRAAEYRSMIWRERRKARRAGVPFNGRMIMLRPVSNFDAVFIPDHFKNLRHFVKIFKYLGVKQMPLFGNHEWRSQALVKPYDPFLNQAFFADFIGSYTKLPNPIKVMNTPNPYFINPRDAQKIDFKLIGYRAAQLAAIALKSTKKRTKIGRFMKSFGDETEVYFNAKKVFKNNASTWPAFVFGVEGHAVRLLSQYAPSEPADTPDP